MISRSFAENYRRLNMKGNSNFKGKNGKFCSKGAKFKRFQWSKNKNKGPIRYGVGVKKSDNDNDDDPCVNNNLLFDPQQSNKNAYFQNENSTNT